MNHHPQVAALSRSTNNPGLKIWELALCSQRPVSPAGVQCSTFLNIKLLTVKGCLGAKI